MVTGDGTDRCSLAAAPVELETECVPIEGDAASEIAHGQNGDRAFDLARR
jgi:hypothetical protein